MLSDTSKVRFPRLATARRLLRIMDDLRLYRAAYIEEFHRTTTSRRRELLEERLSWLDTTWHELEATLRSFQYWR